MSRTVPVLRTWVAGEVATGAYMQTNVKTAGDFMLNKPFAALRSTVGVTMTSANTWYSVPMDAEDNDDDGFHDTGTNNSRITIPNGLDGWYDCVAAAQISIATAVFFYGAFFVNGVVPSASCTEIAYHGATSGPVSVRPVDKIFLNAGDYLEFKVQCSSAGVALAAGGSAYPFLKAQWAHA